MTIFRSCSDTAPWVLFLLVRSRRISCISLPQLRPHHTGGWQSSADAHLASLLCGRTRVTTRLRGPQCSPVVQENQALVNGFEAVSAGFNPVLLLVSICAKNMFERSCTFSDSCE